MARLTRDAMRGKAQTVLGLLDPAALGTTLMHEHLIWNVTPPSSQHGRPAVSRPRCRRRPSSCSTPNLNVSIWATGRL